MHNIQLYIFSFTCDCPTSITNFPVFAVYVHRGKQIIREGLYKKRQNSFSNLLPICPWFWKAVNKLIRYNGSKIFPLCKYTHTQNVSFYMWIWTKCLYFTLWHPSYYLQQSRQMLHRETNQPDKNKFQKMQFITFRENVLQCSCAY